MCMFKIAGKCTCNAHYRERCGRVRESFCLSRQRLDRYQEKKKGVITALAASGIRR